MSELEIVQARTTDVPAIAKLWHDGWHQAHAAIVSPTLVASRVMAEFTERTAAHLDHTFLARNDGQVAGFYMLEGDELYQFYVAPGFQGQGIAAALMASVENTLAGRAAWLACSVGNDRAARFYEKAGWVRRGEEVYQVETAKGAQSVTIWRFEKDLR
jgi:putative acetyltransferase